MRETEHRSTARVLDILELLEHVSNGLSLKEISEALKVPKSSLFPILHTLLERGYLCSESNGRGYRLGSMAFQLGN
ncbi:MAG: helix-turn-helix domain-containing protein, partial [Clostridiales bacterium]|nr:helix-turn-helix domain-containing protein [Clostridiales bacterium]